MTKKPAWNGPMKKKKCTCGEGDGKGKAGRVGSNIAGGAPSSDRHDEDFQILRGFDRVGSDTLFQRVDSSVRTNLKPQPACLDTRMNFFSNTGV
jgi:hypothetical protein